MIKLSVIIPTYNRAKSLKRCLDSLCSQSNKEFEVIIVDGGSTDDTNKVLDLFKEKLKLKKIVFKELELAKARNLGWRKAKGKYVSWIDDDVVTSAKWVETIIETFEINTEVGGVSGPTIIPAKLLSKRDVFFFYQQNGVRKILGNIWCKLFLNGEQTTVGKIFPSGAWSPGSNFETCLKFKGMVEVDYLEACNMTIRKSLVEKVGGFDLGYKKTADWCEPDLAMRVRKLGYRLVFTAKARVDHLVSQQGAYTQRPNAKERMENFMKFYFTHIFKLHFHYIFSFILYVAFLDVYWLYKAIQERNVLWLGGLLGTVTSFSKTLLRKL